MLETVEQLERTTRQRPPGTPPGEPAAALRALAFAESDRAAEVAYHRVLSAVGNDHCGTYFPIVLDIVPYLGEILAAGTPLVRARTLDVLIDLIGAFAPDPAVVTDNGFHASDLEALLRSQVENSRPILESLIADSPAPEVQRLARELLADLG